MTAPIGFPDMARRGRRIRTLMSPSGAGIVSSDTAAIGWTGGSGRGALSLRISARAATGWNRLNGTTPLALITFTIACEKGSSPIKASTVRVYGAGNEGDPIPAGPQAR